MSAPLLLGHRGARGLRSIPENTFASFDRALAASCDGFEFDVRLTADCEAVVCHDPKFHGTEIARARVDEVRELPTLKSVLDRYRERAFLDIELKVPGLEDRTLELLRDHPRVKAYVVSSFLPEVLRLLRDRHDQLPLGLICDKRCELARWRDEPVQYVIPRCGLVTPKLVEQVCAAGKKLFVWTVNHERDMRKFAAMGVAGIISDDPAKLAACFPQKS